MKTENNPTRRRYEEFFNPIKKMDNFLYHWMRLYFFMQDSRFRKLNKSESYKDYKKNLPNFILLNVKAFIQKANELELSPRLLMLTFLEASDPIGTSKTEKRNVQRVFRRLANSDAAEGENLGQQKVIDFEDDEQLLQEIDLFLQINKDVSYLYKGQEKENVFIELVSNNAEVFSIPLNFIRFLNTFKIVLNTEKIFGPDLFDNLVNYITKYVERNFGLSEEELHIVKFSDRPWNQLQRRWVGTIQHIMDLREQAIIATGTSQKEFIQIVKDSNFKFIFNKPVQYQLEEFALFLETLLSDQEWLTLEEIKDNIFESQEFQNINKEEPVELLRIDMSEVDLPKSENFEDFVWLNSKTPFVKDYKGMQIKTCGTVYHQHMDHSDKRTVFYIGFRSLKENDRELYKPTIYLTVDPVEKILYEARANANSLPNDWKEQMILELVLRGHITQLLPCLYHAPESSWDWGTMSLEAYKIIKEIKPELMEKGGSNKDQKIQFDELPGLPQVYSLFGEAEIRPSFGLVGGEMNLSKALEFFSVRSSEIENTDEFFVDMESKRRLEENSHTMFEILTANRSPNIHDQQHYYDDVEGPSPYELFKKERIVEFLEENFHQYEDHEELFGILSDFFIEGFYFKDIQSILGVEEAGKILKEFQSTLQAILDEYNSILSHAVRENFFKKQENAYLRGVTTNAMDFLGSILNVPGTNIRFIGENQTGWEIFVVNEDFDSKLYSKEEMASMERDYALESVYSSDDYEGRAQEVETGFSDLFEEAFDSIDYGGFKLEDESTLWELTQEFIKIHLKIIEAL